MESTGNLSLNKLVRHEEIRLLYGSLPISFTASFIMVVLIYYVLHGHVLYQLNLDIWFFSILSMLGIRTIDCIIYSRSSQEIQQQSSWQIRFLTGSAIGGICWGLLPWLGQSTESLYFDFTVMVLLGIISGSLSSLSYRWEASALFLIPSSTLLMAKLLFDDLFLSSELSFALGLFLIFSLSAGKRIYKNSQQNIRLRLEADIREQAIEVMHQKQLLHLQQTPLAIIEFDVDFKITLWNQAAESIFGYTSEEAINNNVLKLILTSSSSQTVEDLWQDLLQLKPVNDVVVENKTKQGEKIYCDWFITPLTSSHKELVGIAAMALDISDKIQNEQALISSKEEAEKANQAKSNFLSSMSHELRTPLNAILGFTQLLKYEKFMSGKQLSHVNEISNAGNLLLELVNQILDLSRIEKGYVRLLIQQVSLKEIIDDCSAMIAPLAEQYEVSLQMTEDTYGYVNADYTRLKQVLLNLLSNAIKYNKPNGSISIRIDQTNESHLRINVLDTGIGIDEALIDEIFQPFSRLNSASNIEGTGIGLSISKQLIEMMEGTIGASSTPNQGSVFWIELSGHAQLSSNQSSSLDNLEALTSMPVPSSIRILVAEDNPTNQTLISSQLKTLGYDCFMVQNGKEALEELNQSHYDLLLTDCNMPLLDGYQLAAHIRKDGNQDLPIIALTADAFPEKKVQSLAAGMNDHLTKPVTLEKLKQTIVKNTGNKHRE